MGGGGGYPAFPLGFFAAAVLRCVGGELYVDVRVHGADVRRCREGLVLSVIPVILWCIPKEMV